MGRYLAPPPPLPPPPLLLLLLLLLPGLAAGQRLYDQRILDMRSSIVEALGLAGIPDMAKANVSQAEYERAHNEYLAKLRRQGGGQPRSLLTLRPSGKPRELSAEPSSDLSFALAESLGRLGANCSLESALLRLLLQPPEQPAEQPPEPELELRVYGPAGRPLGRAGLRGLGAAGPRWYQLELPAEALAQPRLLVQLRLARAGAPLGPVRASEAALSLQLACGRGAARARPRRGAHGGRGGPSQLWSVHKGRRSECKRSEAGGKRCCRHEMSVSFKDLEGFDFIIQPKDFDAGFCKGRCPPRYNPAHHHALLQSLIWKGDRGRVPRPCCAPSKLAELEVLYFDEIEPTKLKVSNWKDMRVLECACS